MNCELPLHPVRRKSENVLRLIVRFRQLPVCGWRNANLIAALGGGLPKLFAPVVQAFLDLDFHALFGGVVKSFVHTQIILRHEMIRAGVGEFVSRPVAKLFRALIMRVAQVFGNGNRALGFHILDGSGDGDARAVALVRRRNVDRCFSQRNLCLG